MIRLLRWNRYKWIVAFWVITCGHALLFGLLGFDPVFRSAFTYAAVMCAIGTALALPAALLAYVLPLRVHLPAHRRVITRDQADRDGYGLLLLPFVYPDGGMHVHPSALSFPPNCCRCNAPASSFRSKSIRLLPLRVPFCTRCLRISRARQFYAAACTFVVIAGTLTACMLLQRGGDGAMLALLTGLLAGVMGTIVGWFTFICHIGIPLKIRRHDYRRDSAILYCSSRDFAESLLAHLLVCGEPPRYGANGDESHGPAFSGASFQESASLRVPTAV